jgi:hypothetical protein
VRALLKKHGLADVSTTTARRRLMLTVLGRLAEFERELIRARTGERREAIQAARSRRGNACRDWPQLQRVGTDDCADVVSFEATSFVRPAVALATTGVVCLSEEKPEDTASQATDEASGDGIG